MTTAVLGHYYRPTLTVRRAFGHLVEPKPSKEVVLQQLNQGSDLASAQEPPMGASSPAWQTVGLWGLFLQAGPSVT